MNRRTEIIIAVVVLILLGLVLGWILFRGKNTPEKTGGGRDIPVSENGTDVPSVPEEMIPQVATVSASTIVKTFVERFGSYSSESDFANVDDVISLATPTFKNELTRLAANARKSASKDDAYYGISTIVLSTSMKDETETSATMVALTQREEAVGSPGNTTVRYQSITVDLVKDGDDWLIDGFTWAE